MPITELPPFSPRLDDYRAEEFIQHTESLLAFPIQLDQEALDMAPFQVKEPPRAPEPPLPLLPHIWYPKATPNVIQRVPELMLPPRPQHPMLTGTFEKAAERAMRPLLSGNGAITIQGEVGMGKTTLMQHIANHPRTKQRFRRIWWFDDVARVGQLIGIALELDHVLATIDPIAQLNLLRRELDDQTLLVVDNLYPEHPLYHTITNLVPFILIGLQTPPEVLGDDEEIPVDPPNKVTLRSLPPEDAVNMLAELAKLKDERGISRDLRPVLDNLVAWVGYQPFMLVMTATLIHEDHVPIDLLIERVQNGDDPLTISLSTLPDELQQLLEGMSTFSPIGATLDALYDILTYQDEIKLRRGLAFLMSRRLVIQDNRYQDHFALPTLIYDRLLQLAPHEAGKNVAKRTRQWIIRLAETASYESVILIENEHHFRYAYQIAGLHHYSDVVLKLNRALSLYLHTYLPGYLPPDAPPPRLIGERAQAVQMARQGLEHAEQGHYENGITLLNTALEQLKIHGSDHDQAEGMVMLGRAYDLSSNAEAAIKVLEDAARLVVSLGAKPSESIIRTGLAMAYRHTGRLRDALGVLDDSHDTYAERARIYREMGDMQAMAEALVAATDLSPYARAESYLQAGRFADALDAISKDNTPQSYHLRALIYHRQGAYDKALLGYEQALTSYRKDDPERANTYRAIAIIRVLQEDFPTAEKVITQAIRDLEPLNSPIQMGLTLVLSAAISLLRGSNRTAAETANRAIQYLQNSGQNQELAEAYRVLGRASWRLERYDEALAAYLKETEHAQSSDPRDEEWIGQALFHAAEAYRINKQLDRAVANHRRALTHLQEEDDPNTYFILQTALVRALYEQERYHHAFDASQEAITLLDKVPPPDLQYLGYSLTQHIKICKALGRAEQDYRTYMRWLNTLAGRADALLDTTRPTLAILALGLVVRSMLAYKRYDQAQALALEAMNLAEQHIPNTPAAWAARRDYGEVLLGLQQWEAAKTAFTPVLQDHLQAAPHTYAAIYEGTGLALHKLNDDRNALNHYWTALDHQPNQHKQGLIFERVANSYLVLGETDHAIENFNEAMKFLDRQSYPGDAARVLTSLAHTLTGVNRYGEAIGVYENALAMLRATPDASPLHTARVFVSLGNSNRIQGQLQEAARTYREALQILDNSRVSAPDDHRSIALNLAQVMAAMDNYADAIPYFQQARDEAKEWGTQQEVGNITRELAETEHASSKVAESLKTYQQALELLPMQFASDRAAALRSYGRALAQLGQFEEARNAWNEALNITSSADPQEVSLTHHAIGRAYRAQADYEKTEQSFQKALETHKKNTVEAAATYREMGEARLEADRPQDAIKALQTALDIEKTLPQQSNARLVSTLESLGVAEEKAGNPANAITRYHAALIYMDRGFQPLRYAETLRTLARLYMQNKVWDHCQKALSEAVDIELNQNPRSEERLALCFRMMADAYLAEGHLEKAANAYKKMASYANLSNDDTQKLRSTLNDIDRHKATLAAAFESLQVLEKTRAEPKDIAYVYALVVKTYYLLSDINRSRNMMEKLVSLMHANAGHFRIEDERSDFRSLAHLRLAWQHEAQRNMPTARQHYEAALKDNSDPAMEWIIKRGVETIA